MSDEARDDARAGGPAVTEIRDPAVMRALAHPARLAVLDLLLTGRTATATECAELCGLSPSAMSYHLRALARIGLIEEAPSRGDGRERRWKASSFQLDVDAGPDASPEALSAESALLSAFLVREEAQVRRWLEHRRDEPEQWASAAALTETWLMVTGDELARINREVAAIVRPYTESHRARIPEGARRVVVQYRAIPVEPGMRGTEQGSREGQSGLRPEDVKH
jgi:DNA-binding transcriptional ArsR family regulator